MTIDDRYNDDDDDEDCDLISIAIRKCAEDF